MRLLSVITRFMPALAVLSLSLGSCKKEFNSNTAAEQAVMALASAQSDAEAEALFNDVFDNVMGVDDQVGLGGIGIFGSPNPVNGLREEVLSTTAGDSIRCFTITKTQLDTAKKFPLRIVIDFGAGCTGRDGKTRKGKVINVYTGPMLVPGNSSTTTFENHYINDNHVEGTHISTNSSNANGIKFINKVIAGKVTKANGDYILKNSEKTLAMVEGMLTLNPQDDVFKITGNATGTTSKDGNTLEWAHNITEPLIRKASCRWIVKGIVEIRKGTASLATLDYGPGTCDNQAVITVNGQSREINLQ